MSFFRPAKSKPRQFNYVPRYYDPVKEERDRRRRELHGTSVETDNEAYVPGRYIRTQRDARDAAREQSAGEGFRKVRNLALVAVVVVVAILLLYPRFIAFVERANRRSDAWRQPNLHGHNASRTTRRHRLSRVQESYTREPK